MSTILENNSDPNQQLNNANSRFAQYQSTTQASQATLPPPLAFGQAPPPNLHAGYQSFTDIGDPTENPHLFIHVASGTKVTRPWQPYIRDLDDFFERLYRFFKRNGFECILLRNFLELIEILLVTFFTFFLFHGIDYDILFKNKLPPSANDTKGPPLKFTIADCLLPLGEANVSSFEIILLVFASSFWVFKLAQGVLSVMDNWAIRAFYIEVLNIHDPSLYSWQEIQSRLVRNQSQCLIREGQLDELSVHNRLLRRTNYMIALVNKGILPMYFKVPFLGETIYLSKGLEINFELLLFRGLFSLFEKNWKLREEVKNDRIECARRFATRCLVLGLANLLLLPFIFAWQLLYAFYTNVEALKRDPSFASMRTWSRYGRWFCRHFNELEHELDQRMNRAHRPATRYMNSFTSPFLAILARFTTFTASTVLSVIIALTVFDEDVITVEHMLTLATGLGIIIALSRVFLPETEPNRWTSAELDAAVIQHIHYRPHGYPAHTVQARSGMGNIFVYKITTIFEEIISPLVTPFILIRHLRARSEDIIDFFRVYTVELADIGDVCIFSQFNFQQNGHRIFTEQITSSERKPDGSGSGGISATSIGQKAEVLPDERHTTRNGKLELSLIHFKLMNPNWQPADNGQAQFIDRFTRQSKEEAGMPSVAILNNMGTISEAANSHSTIDFRSPMTSIMGVAGGSGRVGEGLALDQPPPSMQSVLKASHYQPQPPTPASSLHQSMNRSLGGTSRGGGAMDDYGFHQKRRLLLQQRLNSMFSEAEERETDMSLSSLYFHQLVADNRGHGDDLGPAATSSSFTGPSGAAGASSSSTHRRQIERGDIHTHTHRPQRAISESIPLLHPSSQEHPPSAH